MRLAFVQRQGLSLSRFTRTDAHGADLTRKTANDGGPSLDLRARLQALGLTERQWRRAGKRHLRDLVGDLPLFDSTWIDACLCDRLITPWQADVLNSRHPDELFADAFVIDSLQNHTPHGRLFAGHHRDSGRAVELVELSASESARQSAAPRFTQLIEAARSGEQIAAQWPRGLIPVDSEPGQSSKFVVFHAVPGTSLRDWLTRRGRMPATVVSSIAKQILDIVAALDRHGIVHGDIRAETVRVDDRGRVTLLQTGLHASLEPYVTYRESMTVESARGIAPERIGTNTPPTLASDYYAIGCLLWELLAGRPITAHGSALGCLHAHLKGELPALSDFAPETPLPLANLIRSLRSAAPEERAPDRASVEGPIRRLPTPSVTLAHRHSTSRPLAKASLTLAATVLAGVAWIGLPEMQSRLADLGLSDATSSPETIAASVDDPEPRSQVMPTQPDASGVLVLPPGDVLAQRVVWSGPITIRGAEDGSSRVVVTAPWEVYATEVRLERVTVNAAASRSVSPLIAAHAQNTTVIDCRLDAGNAPTAITWRALEPTDMAGRHLTIERSRISAAANAISLLSDPQQVELRDTLATSVGSVFEFARWPRTPAEIRAEHCTFRDIEALIACLNDDVAKGQPVRLALADSLVEPTGGSIVMTQADSMSAAEARLAIETAGTIATWPWPVTITGQPGPFVEGSLSFHGDASGSDADSVLQGADVPLPVDSWPGVRAFAAVAEPTRLQTAEVAEQSADRDDPESRTR